ncbi:MAG: LemA family protein [Bacteroidales bacterium]|jgi:LemA protein|nr:LemA family protein [Bacteroidales bacterium]
MKKSLITLIIVAGVLLILVLWGSSKYNSMVTKEEGVTAAWSQVENVYQRRADLIPNLVNTVKGYADFEQKTLTDVIEARSKATGITVDPTNLNEANLQQFQQAQEGLSSALSRLMVVVERYPDLKANQNFMDLQAQLEGTENRIATERRNFNQAAQDYNTQIRRFPSNIFAGMFGFEKKAYFQSEAGAEKAPEVKF